MILLLAQAVPDALSGGAGWVGAGLLGLVLSWLLFVHLPAKDKQLMDLVTNKWMNIKDLTTDYKTSLQLIIDHCEKEMVSTNEKHKQDVERLISLIHQPSKAHGPR